MWSEQAQNYYQIIKRPIDLSVIRRKLDKSNTLHYFTPEQFVDDVVLMFKNCATFNYVCFWCLRSPHFWHPWIISLMLIYTFYEQKMLEKGKKNISFWVSIIEIKLHHQTIIFSKKNNFVLQTWLIFMGFLPSARLWGGPGRPKPRGVFPHQAEGGFSWADLSISHSGSDGQGSPPLAQQEEERKLQEEETCLQRKKILPLIIIVIEPLMEENSESLYRYFLIITISS